MTIISKEQLARLLLKHCEGVGLVDHEHDDDMVTIDGYFDLQAVVDELNGDASKSSEATSNG